MNTALVDALSAWAEARRRKKARRFLEGLSADELQYIADFLGACILESAAGSAYAQVDDAVAAFGASRSQASQPPLCGILNDREHKAILLLEFLHRSEANCAAAMVRTSRRAG